MTAFRSLLPWSIGLASIAIQLSTVAGLDLSVTFPFRGSDQSIVFEVGAIDDSALPAQAANMFCATAPGNCSEEERTALSSAFSSALQNYGTRFWKNDILKEIFSTSRVTDPMGAQFELSSGITAAEGTFLYDMILSNDIRRTLEVGMAYGISTLYILQAHAEAAEAAETASADAHGSMKSPNENAPDVSTERDRDRVHVAIDPNQRGQWRGIGAWHVMRAGLRRFLELREEPSYLALPLAVRSGERYQLILIDGMHTFDFTLLDFFYADKLLEPNGVIVFDDKQMPAVQAVVQYAVTNRRYRLVDTVGLNTVAFATVQKIADDDRSWDFHVPFLA